MKRLTLFLLLTFAGFTLFSQQALNLDFEIPSAAVDGPAHWQLGRLTAQETLVTTAGNEGKALLLQSPFTEFESGMAYQMMAGNGKAFTRYKITARIRTEVSETANVYVYAYGKNDQKRHLNYVNSFPLTGKNDWQEVTMEFKSDDQMDSIRLGCFMKGEGKAWFDDLTFEKVSGTKRKMSKVAKAYFKDFFSKVRSMAIDRENIDWKTLKKTAKIMAEGAQVPADVHATMQSTLQRVNKHSFMFSPEQVEAFSGGGEENKEVIPDIIYAKGHRINDQVAYLSMPGFGSSHTPTLTAWADTIQAIIAQFDNKETTGWVLDLRGNGGGNCWPMLAGVGPLLGEDVCGYFMDRDGGNPSGWAYRDGTSYQGESAQATVTGPAYILKAKGVRIAVLTGPQTASSGEVTTIAFREKDNARSFGQPTAGYSTTNTNIMMSDNAMLLLTISIYGDRNKNAYGEEVVPDVIVEPKEGEDAALDAAVKWLEKQ